MEIIHVFQVTPDIVDAFERLVPQLTDNHPPPTESDLSSLISSNATRLLVARETDASGSIVGALSLVIYHVPTGVRARIEDVVVEQTMRGKGIGELLMKRALEMAKAAGADGVALTSNPRREAANRLYRRLGFKRWETNLYFYEF